MLVEKAPHYRPKAEKVTYLEAVGRTLCGVAPWLANAANPSSPDYLHFRSKAQRLVDAAFLAQALLRPPEQLWHPLDSSTQTRLLNELRATRTIQPGYNNWLLFAAMVEAFLRYAG